MTNIRVAAAGLLLLSSSSAVFAADPVVPPPEEVPIPHSEEVPIPHSFDWSGAYIGAHLGWGFGDQSFPADCVCGPAYDGNAEVDFDGLLGGLQLGYNYQFSKNWLAGVEGDVSWSGIEGSGSTRMRSATTAVFTSKINWFGTLRARFGYVADRLVVYGTGGLAYGAVETNYNYAPEGSSEARRRLNSGKIDETNWGWTAGAGSEYAINDRWSLKGEYLYVNLGGGGRSIINTNGLGLESRTDDFKFHTVRLGINYHF